jgi:glucose-6-phosphate isomerase
MDPIALWKRYQQSLCACPGVGLTLDISRMAAPDEFLASMEPAMKQAYDAMARLEGGAIANPDEQRMVGHYWLRDPGRAPQAALKDAIERTVADVKAFAGDVHSGKVAPPSAKKFTDLLVIGIGGSALGPQLVADALGSRRDKMKVVFIDNTDPDGIDRAVATLAGRLKSTLSVVISKSGGTKETRNGMLEIEEAYKARGLSFARHAVAVTGEGSALDKHAASQGWIRRFPMWDWVGGRTSVLSAVGLLPAALQGLDIAAMLEGARAMDDCTRSTQTRQNPAALMALMWHHATGGRGAKDMVVLPYKDRLLLLSRYLQQLVMESLGKRLDLDGNVVEQGLAVYGNKGSTDQHAYVQQLRDGVNNFFATFIVVLQDRSPAIARKGFVVEPDVTTGDFLNGFWQGTRQALFEQGRPSMTLTINEVNAFTLGAIIALYERTVGLYATLVNINAYHQPGVEAGKKAAEAVLDVQRKVLGALRAKPQAWSVEELAQEIGSPSSAETVFHVLEHLAANKRVGKSRGKYKAK